MTALRPRGCPVPGCPSPAYRRHAMCMPCWRMVSVPVQNAEMRAYRRWCRGDATDAEYGQALWDAVRSVQNARHKQAVRAPRRRVVDDRPGEPRTLRTRPA